ncbi:MAG: hypothetical protein N4A33_09005 [Bacteriovoracaceae bacterium]|jgi:hypothetical protein|nr:hypothetical protein [Bacteriovoracaceae bacterium]
MKKLLLFLSVISLFSCRNATIYKKSFSDHISKVKPASEVNISTNLLKGMKCELVLASGFHSSDIFLYQVPRAEVYEHQFFVIKKEQGPNNAGLAIADFSIEGVDIYNVIYEQRVDYGPYVNIDPLLIQDKEVLVNYYPSENKIEITKIENNVESLVATIKNCEADYEMDIAI